MAPDLRQCSHCRAWTANDDHICVVYAGPACVTCGEPTVDATIGAPGYGCVRVCENRHQEMLTRTGIFTEAQVR
jgi:hypothetical protein